MARKTNIKNTNTNSKSKSDGKKRRYRPGLTEKRMNDKRFRRTEDAILRVFFEEDNYVSMEVVARKVGVARSTFYNHHRALKDIMPDYEKYLLSRYRREIRKLLRQEEVRMRALFFNMVIFILRHKETFEVFWKNNDKRIIEAMVGELAPRVERLFGAQRELAKVIRVYVSELTEVIWMWGEVGFCDAEVNKVLKEIMFLTNTARVRLRPMALF